MRIVTYILLLVILIFGISFACLNSDSVVFNYYVAKHQLPLSLLLVITFAIGCILGLIVAVIVLIKQKSKNMRLQNRIKVIEKELTNLRTFPLKDEH